MRTITTIILALLGTPALALAGERPNVVYILADDMGIGDPGSYNERSRIPTPHIDRLAAQGMRFTDTHSPSGVCTPTRYGLLTGRYSWRGRLERGVLWGDSPLLIEIGRPTVASWLGEAGYKTGCFGKWHLGLGAGEETDWSKPLRPGPLEVGFDRFFGFAGSLDMQPYVYVDGDRPLGEPDGFTGEGTSRRAGGDGYWRAGPIHSGFKHEEALGRFVDEGIAFIEACAGEAEPFFLYLPLTAPHTPWVPAKAYQGNSGAGWYGDFVVEIDAQVGKVLATLERLGLAEETLVVFTSDNGAHWTATDQLQYGHEANIGLRGQKADIWEGGNRVPFIVRWPGHVPAGAVRDDLMCLVDLFATLAGILELGMPEDAAEDSFDFSAVWLGQELEEPVRETLVLHSFDGFFALRDGDWKFIDGLGSGGFSEPYLVEPVTGGPRGQLYDLESDPLEEHNLWHAEAERRVRMSKRLASAKRNGRTRPTE